jgi:hypothetical protein
MKHLKFYKTVKAIAYLGVVRFVMNQQQFNKLSSWSYSFITKFGLSLSYNGKYWTMSRYKSLYNWQKSKIMNIDYELDPFISN